MDVMSKLECLSYLQARLELTEVDSLKRLHDNIKLNFTNICSVIGDPRASVKNLYVLNEFCIAIS